MEKNYDFEKHLAKLPNDAQEEFTNISSGKLLPQLYMDFPFKQIYNPDIHKDRVTKLFQLIFKENAKVISSLAGETPKASVYSKKTIVDLLSQLSNDGILNFEMQVALQNFIVQRIDVYTSDMIMLQYTVKRDQTKSDFSFEDIPHSYIVVFMKESPKIFKDHPSFIHVKEERTDTEIELPTLSTTVYIELDKCLRHIREHGYPEENKELCEWIVLMADSNAPEAREVAKKDEEKKLVLEELEKMSHDKEVLITMLADKYEEIIRNSEKKQAQREGLEEGRALGIVAGLAEGLAEGLAYAHSLLLEDLEELGPVSTDLQQLIQKQNNLDTLKQWTKLARKSKTIEEFENHIQ